MPDYINPALQQGEFDVKNDLLTLSGTLGMVAAPAAAVSFAPTPIEPERAKVPGWLIVLGLFALVMFATDAR